MTPAVLTLNAGSSSIKFGLFEAGDDSGPVLVLKGTVEDSASEIRLEAGDASGSVLKTANLPDGGSRESRFGVLLDAIDDHLDGRELTAVAHRVVHGGPDFAEPILIDPLVLAALEELTSLAPLHQPRCLEPIRAIQTLRSGLRQIACFDTAFHHSLGPPVTRYAIPRTYEADGIRKYGFHGLSYEYVAGRLGEISPELAAGRTVVAHLGNGASLCAMRDGQSVDTTMGFSVLDGLVMGTRCGALDPGVVLHLQKVHGFSVEEVEDILYRRSGLLGVSEVSSDVRTLLKSTDHRAREAIELFAFRVARETAAMLNSLEGLDCLVFTGGIGENAPRVRAEICGRLRWLGALIDLKKNDESATCISRSESPVKILVVPTNEELVIARHAARQLVKGVQRPSPP